MLRILEARERANLDNVQSADTLSSTTTTPAKPSGPPRVSANTITMLLDDRKHCETRKDLERLAVEYDLPLETIESLARYYNSPTMGEEVRDEHDEMRQEDQANRQDERAPPKVRGVWVEPKLQNQISA